MKKSVKIAWIVIPIFLMALFVIFVYALLRGISFYNYSDFEVDYEYTIAFRINWAQPGYGDYISSIRIDLVYDINFEQLAYIRNVNTIDKAWIKYPDTLKVYCGLKTEKNGTSDLFLDTISIYLNDYDQLFELDIEQRKIVKHEYIWQFKKRDAK